MEEPLEQIMLRIAGGEGRHNPGAVDVILQIMNDLDDVDKARQVFKALDRYEIYGSDLWIAYKDICGENIAKLMAKLESPSLSDALEQSNDTEYINPLGE